MKYSPHTSKRVARNAALRPLGHTRRRRERGKRDDRRRRAKAKARSIGREPRDGHAIERAERARAQRHGEQRP